MAKKVYNAVGPELIASHIQETPEEMTYHQYLNMLANSIIDDKTGESLEYIT